MSSAAEIRPANNAIPLRFSTLGVLLSTLLTAATSTAQPPDAAPPAFVNVEPLKLASVAQRQTFVATAMPRRQSVVGSAVDGRVTEFYVEAGQEVSAEEPLAQILTGTLEIEIEAAKAELELREAELAELKNGSRPEEIAASRATVVAAETALEYAKKRFSRGEQLIETGGISTDEFETWQTDYLRSQQLLTQARKNYELIEEGPRTEVIQQAEARVKAQQQAIALLEDRLKKYTLKAPFDGYVVAEGTERGAWLKQGDVVAEVAEIAPIELEAYVPQAYILDVRPGLECIITLDGVANPLPGTVSRVVPQANVQSRTFPVRILVKNEKRDGQHPLLPGMLTHVSIPLGTPRERLLAPKDALKLSGSSAVLVRVADGKAEFVPVRTGVTEGNAIEVTALQGSLSAGDLVVTRGNERLRPGQPVSFEKIQQ